MKLISMSLYGHGAMYHAGAVANVKLARKIYPDWHIRFYMETRCAIRKALEKEGAEIVLCGRSIGHSGMMWRFLAAWDTPNLEAVIFRDSDSRLNIREAVCVKDWLERGLKAHTMHDHPHHGTHPVFGGMWGVLGGILPSRLESTMGLKSKMHRVDDMRWIEKYALPFFEHSLLRHSSIPLPWAYETFPYHEPYNGFVGQQFDEEGNGINPK